MRQGIQLIGQEISLAMKRIYDTATDIVKLNSCTSCCRHTDAVPHPSQSAPRAERLMFQHPAYTPRTAAPPPPPPPVFTTGTNYSGWRPTGDVAASSSQVPRMAPGYEMDDYDYETRRSPDTPSVMTDDLRRLSTWTRTWLRGSRTHFVLRS
ncbi:hypothetical protein EJB05_13540 [Eragrostis curvula]|uniref:Uncharacterized protein n=1 Tax=Eragrostis curvula TaxID=38414 RepID=A0A5J9VWS2_9POAL|nr:hypothetical protein EJB05_13540 [Eragrostis curvula]